MIIETHSEGSRWVLVLAYHMTNSNHAVCGSSYGCQSPIHGWIAYNPNSLPTSRDANSHLKLSMIGMTSDDVQSVRAYCRTNQHARVVNIRSTSVCAKEIVVNGTAESCSQDSSDWQGSVVEKYENHTAFLPDSATNSVPHAWAWVHTSVNPSAEADALAAVLFWKGYGENWRPAFGECDNYHDGNVLNNEVWYEIWAELMPPPASPSPAIFTYARNGWCTASDGCEFDQYQITSGVTLDECKTWCVAIPECVGLIFASASRCDILTEDGVAPTLPLGFPGFGHIYSGHCGSGPVQITTTGSCTSYPCCFKLDGRP